jgi:hypothetical protein
VKRCSFLHSPVFPYLDDANNHNDSGQYAFESFFVRAARLGRFEMVRLMMYFGTTVLESDDFVMQRAVYSGHQPLLTLLIRASFHPLMIHNAHDGTCRGLLYPPPPLTSSLTEPRGGLLLTETTLLPIPTLPVQQSHIHDLLPFAEKSHPQLRKERLEELRVENGRRRTSSGRRQLLRKTMSHVFDSHSCSWWQWSDYPILQRAHSPYIIRTVNTIVNEASRFGLGLNMTNEEWQFTQKRHCSWDGDNGDEDDGDVISDKHPYRPRSSRRFDYGQKLYNSRRTNPVEPVIEPTITTTNESDGKSCSSSTTNIKYSEPTIVPRARYLWLCEPLMHQYDTGKGKGKDTDSFSFLFESDSWFESPKRLPFPDNAPSFAIELLIYHLHPYNEHLVNGLHLLMPRSPTQPSIVAHIISSAYTTTLPASSASTRAINIEAPFSKNNDSRITNNMCEDVRAFREWYGDDKKLVNDYFEGSFRFLMHWLVVQRNLIPLPAATIFARRRHVRTPSSHLRLRHISEISHTTIGLDAILFING